MMTLFWILAVIAACIGIARYNESDSLFWKLFIAFMGGIAAGVVVKNYIDNDEKSKTVMIDQVPTQALESVPSLMAILADTSLTTPSGEKSPKPAGQELMINQSSLILSEVHSHARGQPQFYTYFSDS